LAPPTNEVVARHFLDVAFRARRSDPVFRSIAAEDRPEQVPALALTEELHSPFGENTIVRFQQIHRRVPVYGARATVELAPGQSLSHLDAEVADGDDLDAAMSTPSLSPNHAAEHLVSHLNGDAKEEVRGSVPPLVFYRNQKAERFVLCWLFEDVPAAPPARAELENGEEDEFQGGWEATENRTPMFDYMVDASTGDIVAELSVSRGFDLPIQCTGEDEDQTTRTFDGVTWTTGFALSDPIRSVTTHDFKLAVHTGGSPLGDPVTNPTTAWGNANPAAVTAHIQAAMCHDFFESVLHRQGVDGKGMALISVVNCADPNSGRSDWLNAQWTTGSRMIYGQTTVNGRLVSLARHIDVVAHELMHGITRNTAKLDYEFESGALDESISDIFGVIVSNLGAGRTDPRRWMWELGVGLANGAAMRDLSQPALGSPAQPDHMSKWNTLSKSTDNGGVHVNSGIHNRAGHLVLVSEYSDGTLVFQPDDVARLYYFVVVQLSSNAGFSDARKKLVSSVQTRRQGDSRCAEAVAAVEAAYDAVGIL
jgi:bacillolysin/neutral peptidase B